MTTKKMARPMRIERHIQQYLKGTCDLSFLRGKLLQAATCTTLEEARSPVDPGNPSTTLSPCSTTPTPTRIPSALTVATLNYVAVQRLTSIRPIEVLRVLLKECKIDAESGENGVRPLDLFLTAVVRDRLYIPLVVELRDGSFVSEIVELMIGNGADVSDEIVRKAVELGDFGVVDMARKSAGMAGLAREEMGKLEGLGSPLHDALQVLSYHAVEILLDSGADISFRNAAGLLPIHVAATFGCGVLIKLLLERGADPNALTIKNNNILTRDGANALHLYLWQKHHDFATVEILLSAGTSLIAVCEGNTPLDCFADTRKAQKCESSTMEADYINNDVLRCLLAAGAKGLCHKEWPQLFEPALKARRRPVARDGTVGLLGSEMEEWEGSVDRKTRRAWLRELRRRDEGLWEGAVMREMVREVAKGERHRRMLRGILETGLVGRRVIYVKCTTTFYPFTYGMLLDGARIMFPHENKKKSIGQESVDAWVMHNGNRYVKDDQKDPGFMKFVGYAKF